jgi:hypothetical protein
MSLNPELVRICEQECPPWENAVDEENLFSSSGAATDVSFLLTSRGVRSKSIFPRSCCSDDKNVTRSEAPGVHIGAPARKRRLYPLPWPTARRPLADLGDRALCRTAFASESRAAGARILARSQTRSRMGGQASGHYSSRRPENSLTQRPRRPTAGPDS